MTEQNKLNEDERVQCFFVISQAFDLAKQIINGFIWVSLAYIGYLAIDSLAGKTTIANIILKYLAVEESDYGIPWIVTGVFALWAYLERKFRKQKTESFQAKIKGLEKRLDPNRTTSGLLPSGETHAKDRKL